MSEEEFIKHINETLKTEGFDSFIVEPSEQAPWYTILLYMGYDAKNRERIVEIRIKEQELGQSFAQNTTNLFNYYYMSFTLKLPFECKDEYLYDLGSAIIWLNRTLDIPGFELNEVDSKISYRAVHLTSENFDKQILLSLCGLITLYVSLYADMLENICVGRKTFTETLEEILELTK